LLAFGCLDRFDEGLGVDDGGEVDEGSFEGCDGDPVDGGHVVGVKPAGAVDADLRAALAARAGDGDVDQHGGVGADAPEGCG
jgi:hypothetical protein